MEGAATGVCIQWRTGITRPRCSAVMSLLFALVVSGSALAQDVTVGGTVTTAAGVPLPGVTVRVQGTDIHTVSDANGNYRITAPPGATLTFAHVGEKLLSTAVAGRTTVNATMQAIRYLEEVVVTAYTEQRRADITGRRSQRQRRVRHEANASQRAQGAGRRRAGSDSPDERLARFAEHHPNPRHQLVPEQRSSLHCRRHAGRGLLCQLPEPRGHSIDSGPEGCVGRIDLRIAGQQRRDRDRDDQERTSGTAEGHAARQNRRGHSGPWVRRHASHQLTGLLPGNEAALPQRWKGGAHRRIR